MTDFAGFPKETVGFLEGLSANNAKPWFEAHRSDYEEFWLAPAQEFVEAAGARLADVAPEVRAEPKVNRSIFRINRDTRFSQDKTPYKDHLDMWMWEGERKGAVSGFFFRLAPEEVAVGVGAHSFPREMLDPYRAAVGPDLFKAVAAVEQAGYEVRGEHYKRLPKGYDAPDEDHERMLRYASLWSGTDRPVGNWVHTSEILDHAMDVWETMLPLHRWLVDELG